VAITRQGQTKFHDSFQKRLDPRQDSYYWLEGEDIHIEGGDDLDYSAIKNGYISITPLWCDLTNHSYIEALREWKLNEKCAMCF
jgi:5'-nucleotidase